MAYRYLPVHVSINSSLEPTVYDRTKWCLTNEIQHVVTVVSLCPNGTQMGGRYNIMDLLPYY
eukprot:scaffold123901_cov35-Attheya_sp.AAC.1